VLGRLSGEMTPSTATPLTRPAEPVNAAAVICSEACGSCAAIKESTLDLVEAFTGLGSSVPGESAGLSNAEVARAEGATIGAMFVGSGCGDCRVPDCGWRLSPRGVSWCELLPVEPLAWEEAGAAELLSLRTPPKACAGGKVEGRTEVRGVVGVAVLVADVNGRFTPEKNACCVPTARSRRMELN